MSHYIKKCTVCGTIMEQCRCMALDKVVLGGLCEHCVGVVVPVVAPVPVPLPECDAKAPTEPPPKTVASVLLPMATGEACDPREYPTQADMEAFAMSHYTSHCKRCGQVRLISTSDGVCDGCVQKNKPVGKVGDLKAQVYDLSVRRIATLQTDPALRLAEKIVAVITANTDTADAVDHLISLELAGRAVMETIKHGRGETWLNACIVDASRRIQAYEISWPDQDQHKTIYDEKVEEPTNVLAFPSKPEKT